MKSVLITGAYSPLGHAIAEKFFKENYLVYGTSTREREDGCFKTICVDIRDEKAVKEKLKDIDSLDVLVNNAGIFTVNAPEALTLDDFDSVFDVNVKGMMLVTKYLLPVLKKSNGSIVNIDVITDTTGSYIKKENISIDLTIENGLLTEISNLNIITKTYGKFLPINTPEITYTPTIDSDPATKKYVDNLIAELRTTIDEIKGNT